MKCQKCGFENPDGTKFCGNCGNKFEKLCPQCDSPNPPNFKFCGECGHDLNSSADSTPKELSLEDKLAKIQRYLPKGITEKILSQRDKIEGERKQVTVMFCDMEGYTPLSESIGEEDAYEIMDQVYEILIHAVHDFEGTVNDMTGDGIIALFGAPIALEDAPQRAIRSALAIHKEMISFNDRVSAEKQIHPIKMRVGIHTGPVVVGTVGNDLRVEFKAVGDTVNLASRMEALAEAGTTLITEDTYKQTEGLFLFEALGERAVKGKKEPVAAYQVIAPGTVRTRFDARTRKGLTPFVGRERELELLLDGFQWCKSGNGQAFSIIGEAGMGKSRLLLELTKALSDDEVIFFEGHCPSYSRNTPYLPIIDILKSRFGVLEGDEEIEIREKVSSGLIDLGVDETSTLPYILDLLSVEESGIDRVSMSPEALKNRTLEAMKQILLKSSEAQPLVVSIENLHWIDKSSEDALKHLMESIPGAAILLLFTYRPEYIHSWGGRSYHSQINLNRFSNRESLTMISYLLSTDDIDEALSEIILQKSEGIPLFIEELIKSLKDLKAIEKRDDTYRIVIDVEKVAIPTEIQDIVMARLDSLPEGAKNLAQVGSVVGREFGHNLIEKVVDVPEQELLSYLSVLKDSELLYERGIYPQTTYVFKHALIQDVINNSLLTNIKQKYHHLIANALEKNFPETAKTQPEILGHHYSEAGLAAQAISYLQQAGEMATRRSANVEAVAHYTTGLELLETLAETDERMRQELDLLIDMGSSLSATKGQSTPETERTYTRALELCKKIGNTRHLFSVMRGLYNYHICLGEYQTCLTYSKELVQIADSRQGLMTAHRSLGTTLFHFGDLAEARNYLEQAFAAYNSERDHAQAYLYWADQGVMAKSFLSFVFWLLGYPDQAAKTSYEALNLARTLFHAFSQTLASVCAAFVRSFRREITKTKGLAEEVIDLSTANDLSAMLHFGGFLRFWAHGMEVIGDKAITAKIYQVIGELRSIRFVQWEPWMLCELANVYAKYGQATEGLKVISEALSRVKESGGQWWEAEIYRLKGELLLLQTSDNQQEAESCFNQALDVSRRQQAKSLELRAAMSLSRLWKTQGEKKEEARHLLAEVYDWFTEGFDTADLKEAKALLEELS